ncbi:unnamed protein product [Amoebophrya sp. A25]|nr:unnamed protein product [Amoebophrya sp. A25]|eukprot:GSA25T00007490001.1
MVAPTKPGRFLYPFCSDEASKEQKPDVSPKTAFRLVLESHLCCQARMRNRDFVAAFGVCKSHIPASTRSSSFITVRRFTGEPLATHTPSMHIYPVFTRDRRTITGPLTIDEERAYPRFAADIVKFLVGSQEISPATIQIEYLGADNPKKVARFLHGDGGRGEKQGDMFRLPDNLAELYRWDHASGKMKVLEQYETYFPEGSKASDRTLATLVVKDFADPGLFLDPKSGEKSSVLEVKVSDLLSNKANVLGKGLHHGFPRFILLQQGAGASASHGDNEGSQNAEEQMEDWCNQDLLMKTAAVREGSAVACASAAKPVRKILIRSQQTSSNLLCDVDLPSLPLILPSRTVVSLLREYLSTAFQQERMLPEASKDPPEDHAKTVPSEVDFLLLYLLASANVPVHYLFDSREIQQMSNQQAKPATPARLSEIQTNTVQKNLDSVLRYWRVASQFKPGTTLTVPEPELPAEAQPTARVVVFLALLPGIRTLSFLSLLLEYIATQTALPHEVVIWEDTLLGKRKMGLGGVDSSCVIEFRKTHPVVACYAQDSTRAVVLPIAEIHGSLNNFFKKYVHEEFGIFVRIPRKVVNKRGWQGTVGEMQGGFILRTAKRQVVAEGKNNASKPSKLPASLIAARTLEPHPETILHFFSSDRLYNQNAIESSTRCLRDTCYPNCKWTSYCGQPVDSEGEAIDWSIRSGGVR